MRRALSLMASLVLSSVAFAVPNGIAVLMTDYGSDTIYVGVLKGAMVTKNPSVRIETLTNSSPSYDIAAGAYILLEGSKQWPEGTAFCCVVDPTVGTARRSIAIETNAGQFFVGPDNGLLSLVAQRDGIKAARELTNTKYHGKNSQSSTFHGRDIYGPVTAALAGGADINDLGPAVDDIVQLDFPAAKVQDGAIHGEIIRTDDYGNMVTNVSTELMAEIGIKKGDDVEITIGNAHYTAPYRSTYAEVPVGTRLLCSQSVGMVEAAINQGSLAATLGEGVHAMVILKKQASNSAGEYTGTLHFSQSGGFAGEIDELALDADGKYRLKSRRKGAHEGSIGVDKAQEIFALAKAAFAAKPPAPGGPQIGGADYMTYIVAFNGAEKKYTDLNALDAFRPLTAKLTALIADAKRAH